MFKLHPSVTEQTTFQSAVAIVTPKVDYDFDVPSPPSPTQSRMRKIISQVSQDWDRGSNTWEVVRTFECGHTGTHIMTTHKDGQAAYDASKIGMKGRCKQCE